MFHEKEHISKEQTAYLRRTQKRKAAVWLLQVLLLILFFLLWEIAADCGWIDPFLFSQPTELFATAVKMIRDGSLFLHIGTTLRETVIGFLLGTILGTLTAVLLWWNRFISDVAEPYLVVLNSLPKTALAPIIISASRSTDIPAFYVKWFFNRLAKGYCVWYNPFNRRKMYVSFERCMAIVFWTTNPKPILPYLHELDRRGIHYYFQFTLNDYVSEGFEPNVPSVTQRVETFRELSEMIGKERVIWRFDPLIMTPSITPRVLLSRIWKIGNQLKGYTDKLVFSFVDVKAYRKVRIALRKRMWKPLR